MFFYHNDLKLYYQKSGHGPAIVLLHGNGEDHTIFSDLITYLAPHYTVIALDSRDHGQSARTDQLSYDAMTEDVAALISELALQRPIILGFSDGGIVALLLAIRHPELAGALIVAGANLTPQGLRWYSRILFRIAAGHRPSPKLAMMLHEPQITPAMLHTISVPTLVLAGSRDLIARKETFTIATHVQNAELHILSGETHNSYIRDNTKLWHLISPFLAGLRATD
ncbi:alpha/beta hydrolase [Lacticaseibacillus zeae]|uniref:Alpha/beta hydrolase n=1 Tax=Lacticaseibacillus zeae TaxID=57037 RepID=A0A5R8LQW4_LACZE|nr:alpha/beta hydrolase [Lacticaseibacillus zeae]TLF39629.1 alpha/beta hydrolase [Lacticaseibacillus zeae]